MQIIGLSGKIGTGKTTMANHMIERLGDGWKRIAFGDILKEEASDLFGFPIDWAYDHKSWVWPVSDKFNPPETDMSIRSILQWWGTDVRRKQDPGYWSDKMQDRLYQEKRSGTLGVVVDDCRFLNEINMCKFRVRIEPYTMWRCDPDIASHASETTLDDYGLFDLRIYPRHGELSDMAGLVVAQVRGKA